MKMIKSRVDSNVISLHSVVSALHVGTRLLIMQELKIVHPYDFSERVHKKQSTKLLRPTTLIKN